jgi:hypothetical protein
VHLHRRADAGVEQLLDEGDNLRPRVSCAAPQAGGKGGEDLVVLSGGGCRDFAGILSDKGRAGGVEIHDDGNDFGLDLRPLELVVLLCNGHEIWPEEDAGHTANFEEVLGQRRCRGSSCIGKVSCPLVKNRTSWVKLQTADPR